MRVLIIEDNRQIASALQTGLKPTYAVDIALSGQDGLAKTEATMYDSILLDLSLPDVDGEQVYKSIRQRGVKAPILILTGRDDTENKVSLLDMGADDYITKPYSLEEIKARIRVALRHNLTSRKEPGIAVGDLLLDPAGRSVKRGSQDIPLRRKEFDVLEYLMRNAGQTLTRAMILEHVWDMNEELWANVVDVHIKHLRDKVDRPFGGHLIKTIHGVGYKLDANEKGLESNFQHPPMHDKHIIKG
ncbi:MAG TPA: response regulator transcription factor [Patescibacteria group bacterium]|nr:response regulator transcription factor [Patescibacteria group bacterium]